MRKTLVILLSMLAFVAVIGTAGEVPALAAPPPRAATAIVPSHAAGPVSPADDPWFNTPLINGHTRTCLDANPNTWFSDPGQVYLWTCWCGSNQHWFIHQSFWVSGGISEIRTIGPPYGPSNKCLDAWAVPGFTGGYRVSTWTCNGGNQQQWYLAFVNGRDTTGGTVIVNVRYGKCLDTPWDGPTNGRYVGLYMCHLNTNQQWSPV